MGLNKAVMVVGGCGGMRDGGAGSGEVGSAEEDGEDGYGSTESDEVDEGAGDDEKEEGRDTVDGTGTWNDGGVASGRVVNRIPVDTRAHIRGLGI
jgi:hypothetical protein